MFSSLPNSSSFSGKLSSRFASAVSAARCAAVDAAASAPPLWKCKRKVSTSVFAGHRLLPDKMHVLNEYVQSLG